jgi:hypothetical protein
MRILATVVVAACASSAPTFPTARFANAPPVTIVDDRRDVPRAPAPRRHLRLLHNFDRHFWLPLDRAFSLPVHARALGTNSIDEVPDSTWFTNRIGAREVSPDELRVPASGPGNPERYTPWTIHGTKVGGQSVGFIISDTRGVRFLIKFDERGIPEVETAAHLIAGRLLWACGYNVTDDYIAYVRRSDLVLARDAVQEDVIGKQRRLDLATVERALALIDIGADGRIRTMASHLLEGKALGGHPDRGMRYDDPNDRIPHERRRDLRGARPIFAWLDQVDVKEHQLLDVWVADRADPNRHYVKHYFLDYGKSLGAMTRIEANPRSGHEYIVDPEQLAASLFTLGGDRRPWEDRKMPMPEIVGLGEYGTAFAPGDWKPAGPTYRPFVVADRLDNYWGAKLVMRFSREQLRAAVEAGRLSDPRAVDYLTNALVSRQRQTGAYWFWRVNPLDRFAAYPERVCFDDLLLVHGFDPGAQTTYTVHPFDRRGRALDRPITVGAVRGGRTCAPLRAHAPDDEGYTIVRVTTARPRFRGTTYVHVARDPENGAPRVIGLWRE